jgi:ubiquinone/menaquinone biosynthesis C-methylase UbiE
MWSVFISIPFLLLCQAAFGEAVSESSMPGVYELRSHRINRVVLPARSTAPLLLLKDHQYSWALEKGSWTFQEGKLGLSKRTNWGVGLPRGNELVFDFDSPKEHHTVVLEKTGALLVEANAPALSSASHYETHALHDRDGIGKFYMSREIAQVMGHQGADWLERPEREQEEQTQKMVDSLRLKPGMVVADIGAGTGYVTRPLARKVGPNGCVYAVDIQPEMLTILTNKLKSENITNVVAVLGAESDPKIPRASTDLILLVDVYHELEFPWEMATSMVASLKRGGKLVLVEYRGEDPNVPIKPLHKTTEAQLKKELGAVGLEWVETLRDLPRQHIVVFRKP